MLGTLGLRVTGMSWSNLHEIHELLYISMQVFPARGGAATPGLEFRPFEFDVQRVHETIHQAPEGGDRRQFDDSGAVEMLGELRVCVVVVAGLVPGNELGPPDDRFLALPEERTFPVAVPAEDVELLFGPACRSPDQAIVLDSVTALVQRRDLDHRQRAGPGVDLAAEPVFLQHRLERQEESEDRLRMGEYPH